MSKGILRFSALMLALCILLTGCSSPIEFLQLVPGYSNTIPYEDMEYTRPDVDALEASVDRCIELSRTTDSVDTLMDAIYDFYDAYDAFSTNASLACVRRDSDLSDAFWQREYEFCTSREPTVDAALEKLFCALADSPLRKELEQDSFFGEGFFDDYESDPVIDQTLVKLLEQEAELEGQYSDLSNRYAQNDYTLDDALYTQMAELFIELVKVRQAMAEYLGYPDYPTLAYDMYYYRDYTPEQAAAYARKISELLYEPYVQQDSDVREAVYAYCSERETFRSCKQAAYRMGGTIRSAFIHMDTFGLYDIWHSENKLDSSYETYIWNYYAPFVFMNPYLDQTDQLSLAHEFGHYTADFTCDGTFCGIDVAEFHSTGMEHLFLCYGKNTELLTRYKLLDDLCVYMEQSAYALFEHQVYALTPQELTVPNVLSIFEATGKQFGFDRKNWDPREYVTVLHFFTDPLYTISYVVSNDLAMQVYQMEQAKPGTGLALYEQTLTSQDTYILTFAETWGLQSPFSDSRLQEVAKLFQSVA